MAAVDEGLEALTPEERAYLTGGGTPPPQQPPAIAVPRIAAPATPATPESSSWLPSWMLSSPPSMLPSAGVHERALAMGSGAFEGLRDISLNIAHALGYSPDIPVPPEAKTAEAAHPAFAWIGRTLAGTAATAPAVMMLPEVGGAIGTGALAGATQNLLAGNPDESALRRGLTGGVIGGALGAVGSPVSSWFGGSRTLDPEIAAAGQTAQKYGVTDIRPQNLPSGESIKAMGAAPARGVQAAQIDNAATRLLGEPDIPNFSSTNLATLKNRIGGNVTSAANSGSIDMNAPLPGGASVNDYLSQISRAVSANPEVRSQIQPLIDRINARVGSGGVLTGADFDKLVGSGSVLHDLVGADNPYVKEAAQALDGAMDAGFKNSSPAGAYDNWVDARTKYRMLMGIERSGLTGDHINPTTLFNAVRNKFTDVRGVPVSADPLVGGMGEFASAMRTLYGGGVAPPASTPPGLLRSIAQGAGFGGAAELIPHILANPGVALHAPINLLTPAGMAAAGGAIGAGALRYAGQRYQDSPAFINALIQRGGQPTGNFLAPWFGAVGTQAAPPAIVRGNQ